jgi:hypothetical protein
VKLLKDPNGAKILDGALSCPTPRQRRVAVASMHRRPLVLAQRPEALLVLATEVVRSYLRHLSGACGERNTTVGI